MDAPPFVDGVVGFFRDNGEGTDDHGLCNFAATHGYVPDACGTRSVAAAR